MLGQRLYNMLGQHFFGWAIEDGFASRNQRLPNKNCSLKPNVGPTSTCYLGNFVENVGILLPVTFRRISFSGFRREVEMWKLTTTDDKRQQRMITIVHLSLRLRCTKNHTVIPRTNSIEERNKSEINRIWRHFEFQIEKYQPRLGCWSIPPETDIFLSGTQNWRLIIFLAPTSICLRLKKPPDLFRDQLTTQITPLQRYKPEM